MDSGVIFSHCLLHGSCCFCSSELLFVSAWFMTLLPRSYGFCLHGFLCFLFVRIVRCMDSGVFFFALFFFGFMDPCVCRINCCLLLAWFLMLLCRNNVFLYGFWRFCFALVCEWILVFDHRNCCLLLHGA